MPRFNKIRARRIRRSHLCTEDQEPSLSSANRWLLLILLAECIMSYHEKECTRLARRGEQLRGDMAAGCAACVPPDPRRVSKNLASWWRRTSNVLSSCWKNNMMPFHRLGNRWTSPTPSYPAFLFQAIGVRLHSLAGCCAWGNSCWWHLGMSTSCCCFRTSEVWGSGYVLHPCGKIFDSFCGNSRNPFSTGFPDEWLLKSILLAEAEACCWRPSAFWCVLMHSHSLCLSV